MLKRRSNIAELLDEVMNAGFGISLKRADPALHRGVQQLIKMRNAIVHRGQAIGLEEVDPALATANALFEWLAENPPNESSSTA